MVSLRKRALPETEPEGAKNASSQPSSHSAVQVPSQTPSLPPMLVRLRNMWQFACLCQWIYIFGSVVKLDDLDIDDLEMQCLSPYSNALQDIGLALLKFLSSHRGLTHDLFDEYTRRQYTAKAPEIENPFGTDEVAAQFSQFDVFQKIRVLHQMTQFIMMNPEKLREKMAEQKNIDHDQTGWRIEPFGWDRNDDSYYVLDDNRIYRLIEPPPPPVKPKKNTKKARAEARRKRRRVSEAEDVPSVEDTPSGDHDATEEDDGLGGMKWECVAVTLDEVRRLLAEIPGKKDANEKDLHNRIVEHLLPILEQQEEKRKKREREREKELLNLAKMAHAKRSSRIANRQEQQKHAEMLREEERKRRREQEEEMKAEARRRKLEKERDNRLLSREKRLRERELRRAQHAEELAHLSEDSKDANNLTGRLSERRRLAEIERKKAALEELAQEDDEWVFDCVCGLHGKVDDGQHSIACERCNIWQHSKCLGIDEAEAEKDDFSFVCSSCRRKEALQEALQAASPLPTQSTAQSALSVNIPLIRATPATTTTASLATPASPAAMEAPSLPAPIAEASTPGTANGDSIANNSFTEPHLALQPPRSQPKNPVPVKIEATPSHTSPGSATVPYRNGVSNPFSSPHPELSKPGQSPRKSHAYDTIFHQSTALPIVPDASSPSKAKKPSLAFPNVSPRLPPQRPSETANGHPKEQTPANPASVKADGSVTKQQPVSPSITTPRLQRPWEDNRLGLVQDQASSPPIPTHGGLSPTKHSPMLSSAANSFVASSPTPPIFPPTAALSPSPPEQNLSPPVKPGAPQPHQHFPQPLQAQQPSTKDPPQVLQK